MLQNIDDVKITNPYQHYNKWEITDYHVLNDRVEGRDKKRILEL